MKLLDISSYSDLSESSVELAGYARRCPQDAA